MIESSLTSKGQTMIPKEVRAALGLKPGNQVRWIVADGEVLMQKVRTRDDGGGCLVKHYDGPAVPTEDMDAGAGDYMSKTFARPRSTETAAE